MKKNKATKLWAIILIIVVILFGILIFSKRIDKNKELDMTQISNIITEKGEFAQILTTDIDKEMLKNEMKFDVSNIDEVVGKKPLVNTSSSMFLILKVSNGQQESVKQQLEQYGEKYEMQWSNYLPDQYELVKERKIGIRSNYVYLIISKNNEEIEKEIK